MGASPYTVLSTEHLALADSGASLKGYRVCVKPHDLSSLHSSLPGKTASPHSEYHLNMSNNASWAKKFERITIHQFCGDCLAALPRPCSHPTAESIEVHDGQLIRNTVDHFTFSLDTLRSTIIPLRFNQPQDNLLKPRTGTA